MNDDLHDQPWAAFVHGILPWRTKEFSTAQFTVCIDLVEPRVEDDPVGSLEVPFRCDAVIIVFDVTSKAGLRQTQERTQRTRETSAIIRF